MVLSDDIYGEFEVDKVLEELILSKPVQRLKGVHQGGASYLVNEKWNVTRFDHSIGVMLLIRKLGGSVEEQIAGLLHDVSHTAFSHVVDFVFDNLVEDYHEKIYSSVIKGSEIPIILTKYEYNYKDILFNDSKWTLLEQSAPELCADKVDYTLRDMFKYGQISIEEVQDFLSNLIVIDGKMYLQNNEITEWFVKTYYKEVIDFFMDPLNIYGNDILAKTLKISLAKKLISLDDFLGEDEKVIYKIRSSKDNEVQGLLNQLHQNVHVIENRTHYDLHRKNKIRLIDPSIFCRNELVKASILSEKVRSMGNVANEKSIRGMYVKIISN
ncbi:HD domain-containing protein [Viridibacillus arvi]|uniref:HD domain-containing protein n=1 Tax=Viridibacillus arvi TaxID=263475 RepID=UPI003D0760F8